ncbi:acyl-CoA N-acyltransferase [Cercophora newfieldiana]|uniref:Acyl-CoA N-acyltransferase n=1 Tax=Cercophora newfieldiana TaxID=92897 RepID=A0AA39Y8P6_9PEZI|nr:acyl-CoA N-acyltransferase [Cercophora newfieldiana]
MPLGPFPTLADFTDFWVTLPQLYGLSIIYVVIDKTRPATTEDPDGELAGMISFIRTSQTHLSTEIGGVLILPDFHRTHVASNAAGLMLRAALAREDEGGMGMRRVQWLTSTENGASLKLAKRLGFQEEGVMRWHMVFRGGKEKGKVGNGRGMPKGGEEGDLGRDTIVLSVCWEDWEGGTDENVDAVMKRGL